MRTDFSKNFLFVLSELVNFFAIGALYTAGAVVAAAVGEAAAVSKAVELSCNSAPRGTLPLILEASAGTADTASSELVCGASDTGSLDSRSSGCCPTVSLVVPISVVAIALDTIRGSFEVISFSGSGGKGVCLSFDAEIDRLVEVFVPVSGEALL